MLFPVVHTTPLTTIRRARMLPVGGRVLVRSGQKVSAPDIVAECQANRQHILLDIRRALGLRHPEEADALIQRKVGDVLEKGDVIAEAKGLFTKLVRAPVESTVVAVTNGQVMLQIEGAPLPLLAGLSGTITEVIPNHGVIIENTGALIQGMWGNGRIDQGLLLVIAKNPQTEFTASAMDVSMRGGVLLAGTCSRLDAMQTAAEMSLRGLILSSMSADLASFARSLPFPVVLTEGFGQAPMNSAAYRILSTNERREVCVNAAGLDLGTGIRPEIFIPLNSSAPLAAETTNLTSGSVVRIKTFPYLGQTGIVEEVKEKIVVLPGGLRTQTVVVKLENNDLVTVPLKNIDVLE